MFKKIKTLFQTYYCGDCTITFKLGSKKKIGYIGSEFQISFSGDTFLISRLIHKHPFVPFYSGDRIYIIGGISSTADRVLQSVECYDTRQALWLSGVQDLPYPTRWICCVTINSKYHRPNPDQAVYNLR